MVIGRDVPATAGLIATESLKIFNQSNLFWLDSKLITNEFALFERIGISKTQPIRPFNQHRMKCELARALSQRASPLFIPSQKDKQKANLIEGLRSKIQDKKPSRKGQQEALGAIKTRTKNTIDVKRDHEETLANQLSSFSQDERRLKSAISYKIE